MRRTVCGERQNSDFYLIGKSSRAVFRALKHLTPIDLRNLAHLRLLNLHANEVRAACGDASDLACSATPFRTIHNPISGPYRRKRRS
ncbi:MAG TPA: hypothetical protein VN577_01480 [Terriglobales bacterium]|nr:hypothetical protein [Terriglobales bacterium]